MNSILLSFFLLIANFEADFKVEIEKAYSTQAKIYKIFQERINLWGSDYEICSSIIFPELVRSSFIREKIENIILMNLYTIHGSKFANKSVGIFQIKPTFVEKLEDDLKKHKELERFSFIWEYPKDLSNAGKREIRAKRMLDLIWQIDYLISFVSLLEIVHSNNEKFHNIHNKTEKVAFFSSAYNSGHWYDKDKIINYRSKKFFPYGNSFRTSQYNYSDISVYYYENFINKNN